MYVQETDCLLRKRGGVNYTKRSSPVTRWMNEYIGLIIQIEKEHVRVDYRTAVQRKKGTLLAGLSLYFICYILFIVWSREGYT